MFAEAAQQQPAPPAAPTLAPYAGGLVKMVSNAQIEQEQRAAAEATQQQPLVQGLAAHVQKFWMTARMARLNSGVEERMLQNIRARRGEYDPEKLADIRKTGGSEIYMMLTSQKCRGAGAWLKDIFLGQKDERCWTVAATPMPDLPPELHESVSVSVQQEAQAWAMSGMPPTPDQVEQARQMVADRLLAEMKEQADRQMERMGLKMEDQLVEGNWLEALDQFIDDLTTYPAAVFKGPVVRKRPRMQWVNGQIVVEDKIVLEWERVAPEMCYPSPGATTPENGAFIERHKLTREALNDLIGVEGYDEGSIKEVLAEYGRGGLQEWLTNDTAFATAQGKSVSSVMQNTDGLIDALQYWGSVGGQMLVDWGMDEAQVPDKSKEYQVECWLIGRWVIKATLNPDPLKRRPYYKDSYENIPGAFWGNSVADLVRDAQMMCNAAARAIANNMGISSGPQVWVNVERMPTGEDITQMYPWKIWQGTNDPMGSTAKPIEFFQPQSFVGELMQVYQMFSVIADEASAMPRYMTGDSPTGGAGRTASGMGMLMSNAGKSIKQIVGSIDTYVIKPAIERLYFYNMRYSDDPTLKGDCMVVARGANSLAIKESAQVRRNEFLAATANPMDMQIMGLEGRAALLRENAKVLDMDVDKIVPSPEVLRVRQVQQQIQAMQMAQQQQAGQEEQIDLQRGPDGAVTGAAVRPGRKPQSGAGPMPGNKQQLQNGAPITDNFAPQRGV